MNSDLTKGTQQEYAMHRTREYFSKEMANPRFSVE